jgi:D-alanine-D-alanine ligase
MAGFRRAAAEPFIKGHELTVAVLGDEALAVTELKPTHEFYDYDAKYTGGLTEHVCPAEIPDDVRDAAMDMAPARATGGSAAKGPRAPTSAGTTRLAVAGLYLLEVNTQPGMTPLSLVPEQAKYRA